MGWGPQAGEAAFLRMPWSRCALRCYLGRLPRAHFNVSNRAKRAPKSTE